MTQTPDALTFLPKHTTETLTMEFKKVKTGQTFTIHCRNRHQLIFLIKGKMVMNSSESLDIVLNEGYFCLMPISSETLYTTIRDSVFLVISFTYFPNSCEQVYMRELWQMNFKTERRFRTYAICDEIKNLIDDINTYNVHLISSDPVYVGIKFEEILYIIRTMCKKEEMASLFHPIAAKSYDFRNYILNGFLSAHTVEELAEGWGSSRKVFDQTFNDEFGLAPYRWIRHQKARHVYYALSESDHAIKDVMLRYGFNVPAYFTRFCKDFFNSTPLDLRKRLRIARYSHSLYL